jgi:glycosyltransferase involved in cell wall biosynthesis
MSAILFVHPSAELYGADRTLLQVVEAISERQDNPEAGGARVPSRVVVALPRRGVLAERLEALGVTVEFGELGAALRADLAPGRFGRFLRKARTGARFVESLVKRHGIDIVHTNTTVLIGAAYGAHRSAAKHVWHVHEILDSPSWARTGVRSLIRRWADVAIANSKATAAVMLDPRIECAVTIHNGVSSDRSGDQLTDASEVRRGLRIPETDRLAVLPGRVNSWKGHRLSLDAIEALGDAAPHLVFAGSPPPGQEHFAIDLDAEIRKRRLEGKVTRIPFTEDLPSLLAAADVCLVPSTRPEPFGLVAIEAMAVGTPVVGAGHGGLVEIVEDCVTGQLFEPCSSDSLAAAIKDVLSGDERLEAMGAAAQARQQALFTHEGYAQAMLDVYGSLTAPWSERKAA